MPDPAGRQRPGRARSQLIQARRRDLVQDLAAGSGLAFLGLIWTAGLGVLALIALLLTLMLLGTSLVAHHRRRRPPAREGRAGSRRPGRTAPGAGHGSGSYL
jgi:hypothetical protein